VEASCPSHQVSTEETHTQTMRSESLRILLTIALAKGWKIRQWDVVVAYLQATLGRDNIYVTDINEVGALETPQSPIWAKKSWS
jgi:sirohydrochlorin ferrochelatase